MIFSDKNLVQISLNVVQKYLAQTFENDSFNRSASVPNEEEEIKNDAGGQTIQDDSKQKALKITYPLEVLKGIGKHFEDHYHLTCEFDLTSSVFRIGCFDLENENRYLFTLEISN